MSEVVAWSRSELEDLLFAPENDHLPFAYFGISLSVRRNALGIDLRRRLATKRRFFDSIGGLEQSGETEVLVRDPTVAGYPFKERVEDFDENDPPWMPTLFTSTRTLTPLRLC